MADQTGLNKTLQSNAAAYNPDCTADMAAYQALRQREMAGRTPDSTQIQGRMTRKPGKTMPAPRRGK